MPMVDERSPLIGPRATYSKVCAWRLPVLLGCSVAVLLFTIYGLSRGFPGLQHWHDGVVANITDSFHGVMLVQPTTIDPKGEARINATVLHGIGSNDGHLAIIDNASPHFHVAGTCMSVSTTSTSAKKAACRYAVNGGPFQSYFSGGCIGPTISFGGLLNADWNTSYASFGRTSSGEWLIGHITEKTVKELGVSEVLTGFGWLVRSGAVVPMLDDSQVAERTAIGVDEAGRLMLLQVDGCEWCPFSGASGLSLRQAANLLVELGAIHAINLDGGGSSVTVVDGQVVSTPHCLEVGLRCERPVTSIACIS